MDDYSMLQWKIKSNPAIARSQLLDELNERRKEIGLPPVSRRTFYRVVEGLMASRAGAGVGWLEGKGIVVAASYSVERARTSLETHFTYDNLTFRAGVSVRAFSDRLDQAEMWFRAHYPGVEPLDWYPQVAARSKLVRNQLSTIASDELPDVQGRLAFERQVCFLMEGYDWFLDKILMRWGRVRQSRNATRAALERDMFRSWAYRTIPVMKTAAVTGNNESAARLREVAAEGERLPVKARREAMVRHRVTVKTLWELLSHHTGGFATLRLASHGPAPSLVLDLVRDPARWKGLSTEERCRVTRDPVLLSALEEDDPLLLKAVLLDRFLGFLKSGKIVDPRSWQYGDLGERLASLVPVSVEEVVTRADLEALVSGSYRFPPVPDLETGEDLPEEGPFSTREVTISELLDTVADLTARHNPGWFEAHREVFRRQSDGMFQTTYTEGEFRQRLYQSIGFLGRNLRYSDDPGFQGLKYFIQRYLSDEVLDLETRHLWNVIKDLSGQSVPIVLVDTMGIDARRKSFFARLHGRYRTVGFSDLRAVAHTLVPVYSANCRSTDSEAMNIIPVLAHARSVLGDDLRWYTGNSHTVSRLAAGMAFAAYRIIAAGRVQGEPRLPGLRCRARLLERGDLINRLGHVLRNDPSMGRMLASHQHYYVDGVNVYRLLEDLGSLVLWTQRRQGIKLDHLAQLIETSNRQKRVVRIIERGVTRVHEPNVSLALKSAELLLCAIAVWRLHEGARRLVEVGNPVSLDGIVLFRPA